jgi:hypothetical protein
MVVGMLLTSQGNTLRRAFITGIRLIFQGACGK